MPFDFVRLDQYAPPGLPTGGASLWKQLLWFFVGDRLVQSYLIPISGFKVWVLRRFGAIIGQGVRIKPGLRVKFPWLLTIGDHCWIGEQAWFDNIEPIVIENQVCISQAVYLCTGNHDWSDPAFRYRSKRIHIESGSWLAAKTVVGPGVTIKQGAILSLGSVTAQSLEPMTIYAGNPAQPIKQRVMRNHQNPTQEKAPQPITTVQSD
ncbi:MAG: WcaF family extracellular polysaccharide biosynthesis acetyltransferase [Tildeniella nuda ZEHNDER 1965/U140]|jgi:putative colanic acid biosynthesis acetyltransferase WcaF|nr:WcaF family extracellular polysaccharide biosynthesis acetyltransferase [Tildeniella nuda ZEHNDER 1965/U140]